MGHRIGFGSGRRRDRKRIALGSVFFVLSLYFLWVTFNALFMVPGMFDLTRIMLVGLALLVAFGFAFASGRQFISARAPVAGAARPIWSTAPILFWLMAVAAYGGLFLLARL